MGVMEQNKEKRQNLVKKSSVPALKFSPLKKMPIEHHNVHPVPH